MRTTSFLFASILSLSMAMGCKQKPSGETQQPASNEKAITDTASNGADTVVPNSGDNSAPKSPETPVASNRDAAAASPSGANPALWKKIEIHINSSTVKEDATMKEVMTVMGKGWHYDITQLWFFVQFNKKKKRSTGVKALTEANFYDQYDREYDIAIRGGY